MDEMMSLTTMAMNLDESNYLAYLVASIGFDAYGIEDLAQDMLAKCNELLPPSEAFIDKQIFGGQGGHGYIPKPGH